MAAINPGAVHLYGEGGGNWYIGKGWTEGGEALVGVGILSLVELMGKQSNTSLLAIMVRSMRKSPTRMARLCFKQ